MSAAAPDAQKQFLSAADALDRAGPKLPNAPTEIAQANSDYAALTLARNQGC